MYCADSGGGKLTCQSSSRLRYPNVSSTDNGGSAGVDSENNRTDTSFMITRNSDIALVA
jgi:hypothetical protein